MWEVYRYLLATICFHAGQTERGLLLARTQGGSHRRAGHNHCAEGMASIFYFFFILAYLITKT